MPFAEVWQRPEVRVILETLRPLEMYLVGGAVRDLLLDRPVKDFDFLVDCTAEQMLALMAPLKAAAGVTVIPLDRERGILRVCYRDSEGVDLAARQGATVGDDLARRDVTFNAMALGSDGELLDPFDGRADLERRVVRATSAGVLESDPLRVLRCVRLAATLDFELEEGTRGMLPVAARGLSRVAGERIWEELGRFLTYVRPLQLGELRAAGVVEPVWGGPDSRVAWDWLAQAVEGSVPRSGEAMLALLAALLEGRGEKSLERLKVSRAQLKFVRQCWAGWEVLRRGHPVSAREVYALVRLGGTALPELLALAVLPAFENRVPDSLRERLLEAMLGRGELRWDPLPLDGEVLCERWGRAAGRWLGPVLAELETAWACREVDSREELVERSGRLVGGDFG